MPVLFRVGNFNTYHTRKYSGIGDGISFEHACTEYLFFTGFEREEKAVCMVRTDICKTPLK